MFLCDTVSLNPVAKAVMTYIWRIRDELSTDDSGLLLRGLCIVEPTTMWSRVIELAHQEHQGISKTKARFWNKV